MSKWSNLHHLGWKSLILEHQISQIRLLNSCNLRYPFKGLENVTNRFSTKFWYKQDFFRFDLLDFVFFLLYTMSMTMTEYFKGIGDVTNRSGPVSFARIPIFRSIRAFSSAIGCLSLWWKHLEDFGTGKKHCYMLEGHRHRSSGPGLFGNRSLKPSISRRGGTPHPNSNSDSKKIVEFQT